jgi:hypothetical protein
MCPGLPLDAVLVAVNIRDEARGAGAMNPDTQLGCARTHSWRSHESWQGCWGGAACGVAFECVQEEGFPTWLNEKWHAQLIKIGEL